ncbi:SERPIN domain-containing protein [Meloidogyne graminicola]|uniref:SERPIN domain-containing protein n=1 Tax=Meloidogyne graminicola TaxID=189291 RepID=A0A8S9ZLK6_9BILA|nr:SERPIN domain-containing protein [Meloidogyne graminicola]
MFNVFLNANLNEEGTEAAAATAIEITRKSLPPPRPRFNADHPFAFMLVNKGNEILFNGIFKG